MIPDRTINVPIKEKEKAKIEKAKADKELWADVKMVLFVLGAIIAAFACIGGAIYYTQ